MLVSRTDTDEASPHVAQSDLSKSGEEQNKNQNTYKSIETSGMGRGAAEHFYGLGIHSYYAKDFEKAWQYFEAAANLDERTARYHYFQGLAELGMGDKELSGKTFKRGAEREKASLGNQFREVSRSLEKIQGAHRRILETHRIHARF